MNEFIIQNALYNHLLFKGHELIIPNIYLSGGAWSEADLISVTKAGYISEYEIKISRADFRADFKKRKHHLFEKGQFCFQRYFWFATPSGLVKTDEIPKYAGHIEVVKTNRLNPEFKCIEKKKPKRLDGKKINTHQKEKICRGYMFRFWEMRNRLENKCKQLSVF